MTSNNREHHLKRENSEELALHQKNQPQEDPEKMSHSQYKPELQMPIKIQGNSRISHSLKRERRNHLYANQSSEPFILNDPCSNYESKHEHFNISKENPKDQSQILIHSQIKLDQLESLQLPLYDHNSNARCEANHYGFQDEYSVKIEENDEDYDIFQKQIQEQGDLQDGKLSQQRKSIYFLMNKLRAFLQTSQICANSKRLIRKDSINKMRSNALIFMTKENKRLFIELQKHKQTIEEILEKPKNFNQRMKQTEMAGSKDALFKTGLEDEEPCIKQEIFEMDQEKDEK